MTDVRRLSEIQLREELHRRLRRSLGAPLGDRAAYHLADLHTAFQIAAQQIEQMAALPSDATAKEERELFAALSGQLFSHIRDHIDGLRPVLEARVTQMFEQADARGDL